MLVKVVSESSKTLSSWLGNLDACMWIEIGNIGGQKKNVFWRGWEQQWRVRGSILVSRRSTNYVHVCFETVFKMGRFTSGKSPRNLKNQIFWQIILDTWSRHDKVWFVWPRGRNEINILKVYVWKPQLPTNILVSWYVLDYQLLRKSNKCQWCFLSSPTLLTKFICVGTAANSQYL